MNINESHLDERGGKNWQRQKNQKKRFSGALTSTIPCFLIMLLYSSRSMLICLDVKG